MLPLGLWGLCWMEGKEKQPDCWWRHANQWEKTGGDPSVCLSVSSSILRQVQRSADKQTQLPDITPICETQSKFWKNWLGIWKKERGKWKLPCPQGKAQGPSGKPSFPSLLSLIYLRKIKKNTDWNKKKKSPYRKSRYVSLSTRSAYWRIQWGEYNRNLANIFNPERIKVLIVLGFSI